MKRHKSIKENPRGNEDSLQTVFDNPSLAKSISLVKHMLKKSETISDRAIRNFAILALIVAVFITVILAAFFYFSPKIEPWEVVALFGMYLILR